MRFNVAAFLAVGAAVGVVGCGSSDDGKTATATTGGTTPPATTTGGGTTAAGATKYTIAVIPKGSTHEYWNAIHAGANDAGKELNVKIDWEAPEKEDDQQGQSKLVDDAVQNKDNGICLAPLSDTALRKPVQQAMTAGVPVVIMDSGLQDTKFSSYVATDNEDGGRKAGDYLAKILGEKGNVIMIRYQAGSASTDLREKGFEEAIKKYPGIKIVSDNQYAGVTQESAQHNGEAALSSFKKPDGSANFDGLFCPNESSAAGLLRVLEGNKWAGKLKFVGFDSSTQLVDGLTKGEINGLIVQNPYKMGHDAVKIMVDVLDKKPFSDKEDTGATLVTQENMKTPDMDKLLHPPAP